MKNVRRLVDFKSGASQVSELMVLSRVGLPNLKRREEPV
jgi:hypothetical protein